MRPIDLVTMDGRDLLDLMEDLGCHARRAARDWRVASLLPPDPELATRKGAEWDALAGVFEEARCKVYAIVKDRIHNESCGA